jgi:hypothetical protein
MLRRETVRSRVKVDVVSHEGGDEVVGVIVERLHPQRHRVVDLGGGRGKVFRL